MRVMIVTEGLWNGGAERQLALLATSLPAGWSCTVASLQDGPYRPVLEEAGIDVTVFPRSFRLDVRPAFRLWRAANAFRPDVVHAWGWMSTLAMLPYCRMRRTPIVNGSIRHGGVPDRRSWIDRLAVDLADAVVANSRAGLRAYGAEGPRGHVIHNGFDTRRLQGLRGGPAPRRNGTTTVVMAARMCADKDWRAFINAARVLTGEDAGWRFVGMGDGPDRAAVLAFAADLIAENRIEFPEPGLEVLPAVARADIGLLLTGTSAAEGCSNAVLEYMACGLPVICTDAGGSAETVEHGGTGLLVPAGDHEALLAALRRMRRHPDEARGMGDAGRSRVAGHFSTSRMVGRYLELYESLVREPARP